MTGRTGTFAALAIFLTPMAVAETQGDAAKGERLFKQCARCHEIGAGAENRVGPQLNGIFGRTAGAVEDFRYSKAFQRAGAKGLECHADKLGTFLENPKQLVPGNRMGFKGLADETERANLIAFLRQYSDNPRDIPEADATATPTDHDLDPTILAIEGDAEYGEYLSSECTACHRIDGSDEGIPSIVLWPEQDFVVAMQAFKSKSREHPVMNLVAGRLGDEEIAALAAYFSKLEE